MLSEIINLHLSTHPDGLTAAEVSEDVWIDLDVCRATLSQMERKSLCNSDGKRPKRYTTDVKTFTSDTYDEYVHRVIAREDKTTMDDLVCITYLSRYRLSRSVCRLKNLGKISTMTGEGITLEKLPAFTNKRPWLTTDLQWLRDNAGKVKMPELVQHLNRTERAVAIMLMKMGLSSVTRLCRRGHNMHLRRSGKWVCNVCHRGLSK